MNEWMNEWTNDWMNEWMIRGLDDAKIENLDSENSPLLYDNWNNIPDHF